MGEKLKDKIVVPDSYFGAISSVYLGMFDSVLVITLFAIMVLTVICEATDQSGPIEWVISVASKIVSDTSNPRFVRTVSSVLFKIFTYLAQPFAKKYFVVYGMYFVTYFQHPFVKNLISTVLALLVVTLLVGWTVVELFILGQFWFIYVNLNNNVYKLYTTFLGCIFFFSGWFILDVKYMAFKNRRNGTV